MMKVKDAAARSTTSVCGGIHCERKNTHTHEHVKHKQHTASDTPLAESRFELDATQGGRQFQ